MFRQLWLHPILAEPLDYLSGHEAVDSIPQADGGQQGVDIRKC